MFVLSQIVATKWASHFMMLSRATFGGQGHAEVEANCATRGWNNCVRPRRPAERRVSSDLLEAGRPLTPNKRKSFEEINVKTWIERSCDWRDSPFQLLMFLLSTILFWSLCLIGCLGLVPANEVAACMQQGANQSRRFSPTHTKVIDSLLLLPLWYFEVMWHIRPSARPCEVRRQHVWAASHRGSRNKDTTFNKTKGLDFLQILSKGVCLWKACTHCEC